MTFKTTVKDPSGNPIQGAFVQATDEISGQSFPRSTDGLGYADVAMLGRPPVQIGDRVTLLVLKDGYAQNVMGDALVITAEDQVLSIVLSPLSFRPPLEKLAQIRGAMWTARLNLPFGPRPGRDDNLICIDYWECFSPSDHDRIIGAYGKAGRGYTHAPMGPIIDPGYHGQLPSTDWRSNPDVYLDATIDLQRRVGPVIHFLRPDRGVVGLEWTVADLDRELGPIFRSDKAQRSMWIVCLGWEPGPKYYYRNAWWVEMCQWMASTFPKALRLIHMTADTDAPVGGDDDKVPGLTNGKAWQNVAPYLHGWLVQNAGYAMGGSPTPTNQFITEFTKQFDPTFGGSLIRRFTTGGPTGDWPTSSAWGQGKRLKVYAGEFAAYGNYWHNFPEEVSRDLGALAMRAGADGYLDGGR